jgi:prepilin-type N-terminal cleavage/methylation domain-containing protein
VRLGKRRHRADGGFTLLELMIATVVMAIIFMGLISSITGSFLATGTANKATESQAIARQMLEEAMELSYGDMLLLDGDSLITADGLAAKYQVFEVTPGLLELRVEICRPYPAMSLATLSAMSMTNFHGLTAIDGSRLWFVTLSTGVMARATVTNQKTGGGGTGSFNWY